MVSDEPCEATEVPASELRIECESSGTVSVTSVVCCCNCCCILYRQYIISNHMPICIDSSLFPNHFDANEKNLHLVEVFCCNFS